jgi:hypothetical protein
MRRFFLAAIGSRRRITWTAVVVSGLVVVGVAFYLACRERAYDAKFDTRVANPAYQKDRPRVLFDEAHLNSHTTGTAYKPFADLIRNDGYDVHTLQQPITNERLSGYSVLIVVLPRGTNGANDASAFTEPEIATIEQWVRSGGSLLLITDHFPFGAASASLAQRLDVDVTNGLVEDPKHHETNLGDSHLIFSRENGLLRDHPITRGRNQEERVDRVLTFTGTSLRGPAEATALLSLSDSAVDRPASTPKVERVGGNVRVTSVYGDPVSAKGRSQALALEVGNGRVVVLGEAGMLSAQRDRRGSLVGMNVQGFDNRQLALNVMHWLSRLL